MTFELWFYASWIISWEFRKTFISHFSNMPNTDVKGLEEPENHFGISLLPSGKSWPSFLPPWILASVISRWSRSVTWCPDILERNVEKSFWEPEVFNDPSETPAERTSPFFSCIHENTFLSILFCSKRIFLDSERENNLTATTDMHWFNYRLNLTFQIRICPFYP